MSEWSEALLSELTTKIGSGATPRGGSQVYTAHGVTFIRSQNVLDHSMKAEGLVYLTDDAARALNGVAVELQDVLINITGDSIARCAVVDPSFLPARVNQHVAILRPTSQLDHRFLQRYLVNPIVKETLIGRGSGATRNALTKASLGALRVRYPSIERQQAIAEVLGAFDDKIAANTKLASTADDISHALFLKASSGVAIGSQTFADVAVVSGGGTPSTSRPDFWDGGVGWATPTDITALRAPYLEETSRTITSAGLAACASRLFSPGAILMTSRATIGAMAILQSPAAVNQGFIVVEPHNAAHRYWLFHEMRSRAQEFLSWANGATFLELSRGNFKRLPVLDVDDAALKDFDNTASALHAIARASHLEIATLAALRDTLLPQLMSGKLRVRDAERTVSEVL